MARTYPWSESTPDGSVDDISTIDNAVRRLRLEIREIINQIIGVAEATDLAEPIVAATNANATLRTELTAAQADITTLETQNAAKTIIQVIEIGSGFWTSTGSLGATVDGLEVPSLAVIEGYIPLTIPVGAVLTDARIHFSEAGAGTTFSAVCCRRLFNGATASVGVAVTAVDTDMINADHTIEEGYGYFVYINLTAGSGTVTLQGLKITYNSASPAVRI